MPARATSLTTVPRPSPDVAKALALIEKLRPEDLAAIRVKLAPAKRESPIPRDIAGGLAATLPFLDVLEEHNRLRGEGWTERASRYYFSKLGRCFRYSYWAAKGHLCDCGNKPDACPTHRFPPGKSQAGVATERGFQTILEETYASNADGSVREGIVLKDIRMTEALKVAIQKGKKTVEDLIFLVGKSDQMLVGDNLEILNFYEVKSPFWWPKDKVELVKNYGAVVPLSIAGVEEHDNPNGVVNLNQLLQLAAGAHILRMRGRGAHQVTLFYIDRSDYGNHLEIILTPEQCEILHDWAVWWATEHHTNLQSDKVPPAQFCMDWECKRCPFDKACAALLKQQGGRRMMCPAVTGINARLVEAANGEESSPTTQG